jgi:hypothetical protein
MTPSDPAFIRPAPNMVAYIPAHGAEPPRLVEKIAYDVWFTDELIRRCQSHATRGYRLAATLVSSNKSEVTLVFEAFEWNGVRFPASSARDDERER